MVPFCTHDGYGAGGSYNTIREVSHAAVSPDGLAIEAKDVLSAKNTVTEWLSAIGMAAQENAGMEDGKTAITMWQSFMPRQIIRIFPLMSSRLEK